MSLTDFSEEHIGRSQPAPAFSDVAPAASTAVAGVVPADRVESLLATLFWQIVRESPLYDRMLRGLEAALGPFAQTELIITPHGPLAGAYHDLLLLSSTYTRTRGQVDPQSQAVQADTDALLQGYNAWRLKRIRDLDRLAATGHLSIAQSQTLYRLVAAIDPNFAFQVAQKRSPTLLVAQLPDREVTAVPPSPWVVGSALGPAPTSTAGAVVRNASGTVGVTASFHALAGAGMTVPLGTSVTVAGAAGTVGDSDLISDSCFVVLPALPPGKLKTTVGPLSGVSPRQNDKATFDGGTSGAGKTAIIQGWSPDIPFVLPQSQLKVFTDPVTIPGDSGAGLLEPGTGHILGFSFYRTGVGSKPAFSAWIWAESVFSVLKITAL